jgi:small conductance mechanosensitive channel
MIDEYQDLVQSLLPVAIEYSMSALGAIAILIAGWIVAGWASRKVYNLAASSQKFDATLAPILRKIVRVAILIITILAVLGQFGIETASVIAVLGAATLAIGLALQGTLSNVAAGVMLLIFRPFEVGQSIMVSGISGSVVEIGIFTTTFRTFDGLRVVAPNARIWGNEITNFSANDTRRLDISVGIGYGDDMDKAIEVLLDMLNSDERVLEDPAPQVMVSELGDSSVNLIIRSWISRENFWGAKWDLTKLTKEVLDKNEINIPFPQRDIHVYQAS